jgi:hypothetical protein
VITSQPRIAVLFGRHELWGLHGAPHYSSGHMGIEKRYPLMCEILPVELLKTVSLLDSMKKFSYFFSEIASS